MTRLKATFSSFYDELQFIGLEKANCNLLCNVSSDRAGLDYFEGKDGQLSFLPRPNAIPVQSKRRPYRVIITEVKDENNDGRVDLADVEYLLRSKKNVLTLLSGDGDFRSAECIELLKQADIVCTNPPFSLFREYMAQLIKYGKQFLIIGNQNNVCYSDIFPLIRDNKVWLGYNNGHFWFKVPDSYEEKKTDFRIDETGQKWRRMGNICWFTNLDIDKRHDNMPVPTLYC